MGAIGSFNVTTLRMGLGPCHELGDRAGGERLVLEGRPWTEASAVITEGDRSLKTLLFPVRGDARLDNDRDLGPVPPGIGVDPRTEALRGDWSISS